MKGPYLWVLSEDELKQVHQASLRILEETGMMIDHAEARELLQAAGARVDHDSRRVYFPRQLVETCLGKVPRRLTYHGRTSEYDFVVEAGGRIFSRTAGGAMNYVDLQTFEYRRARLIDWQEFVTLADALPNINALCTMHCSDVPDTTSDLHSLHVLLEFQHKPIVHHAGSLKNFRNMLEMMLAVSGTSEALRDRPPVHHLVCPTSPLYIAEDDTAQLLLAVRSGIPMDVPIMPLAGLSAPITLAGAVAMTNAEFLGTMTLIQTVMPGHPMPYFIDPVVADMRRSNPLMGAPEVALLNAAITQVGAELYGLPPEGIGLDSDSVMSGQTMFQKACNMVFQVMAGGKLIVGAGIIEACMAASPAQLVIDDEIVAIARRLWDGFAVTDDTLATHIVNQVGPRGTFVAEEHTTKYLRLGELFHATVFDGSPHSVWESQGRKDLESRARDKANSLLQRPRLDPLPSEVARELRKVVEAADREIASS